MAKNVRARPAPSNGAPRALSKATADNAGDMVKELLALDLDDERAVAGFVGVHTGWTWQEPEMLRARLARFRQLTDQLRAAALLAEEPEPVENSAAKGERRARVVDAIKRFLALPASADGPDFEDFVTFVGELAASAPELGRLIDHATFVREITARASPKDPRPVSVHYLAAALALEVGGFGATIDPGETEPAACRRVAKLFDRAVALRESAAVRRAVAPSPSSSTPRPTSSSTLRAPLAGYEDHVSPFPSGDASTIDEADEYQGPAAPLWPVDWPPLRGPR